MIRSAIEGKSTVRVSTGCSRCQYVSPCRAPPDAAGSSFQTLNAERLRSAYTVMGLFETAIDIAFTRAMTKLLLCRSKR